MLKTFLIGIKDLRLAFRDRAALILMLAAPFVLTLGLGLVTGRFSGNNNSGLSDIPVIIVNLDNEQLGNALADVFTSEELADLMEPSASSDPEAARKLIDEDEAAAVVIIPEGFTRSIIPQQGDFDNPDAVQEPVKIEVYANPSRPTGAGIVKAVVDEFLSRVNEGSLSGGVSILQLMLSGRITPDQAEAAGIAMGERLQTETTDSALAITINSSTADGEEVQFDILAYLAPGMALMFLMYTVSYGGRSILAEKAQGTLPRLLVSPTSSTQILGGKVFGIFLTGAAQMLILIGASSLFFQLKWGDPFGVIILVLAAVFGATGWGMFITALARTPAQVASVGSAIMLIFGIMGGSFISLDQMPPAIQTFSKITPNAWALDGFTTLGLGGTLADLSSPIVALLTMGTILFLVSVVLFGKKNLVQK
ncbi:ABC transporter permease [Candidatus Villigracilis saccharophilus]|uniref:ABC transporter permease n=1 Tax=Candidatus Villigracilis saccharophilus TaxID=3140684 RepID=UPI003135C7F5|nr:ABC transporter permease [Anaerolineales bacterium]